MPEKTALSEIEIEDVDITDDEISKSSELSAEDEKEIAAELSELKQDDKPIGLSSAVNIKKLLGDDCIMRGSTLPKKAVFCYEPPEEPVPLRTNVSMYKKFSDLPLYREFHSQEINKTTFPLRRLYNGYNPEISLYNETDNKLITLLSKHEIKSILDEEFNKQLKQQINQLIIKSAQEKISEKVKNYIEDNQDEINEKISSAISQY